MSLIRKGLMNTFGTAMVTVITMTIGVILSRSLAPDGMGQYQLCLMFMVLIVAATNLGVGQASIFFMNSCNESREKMLATTFIFGMISGCFSAILLFVFLQIKTYFGELSSGTIILLSCSTGILSCHTSIVPIFIAELQIKNHVLVQIVRHLTTLILLMPVLLFLNMSVNIALVIQGISFFVSFLWLYYVLRKHIGNWKIASFSLIKKMIGFGLKLSVGNIINLLNIQIGLFLIRYYFSQDFTYVGYYGRASSVAGLFLLLSIGITPIFYSRWSSLDLKERLRHLGMATRLMNIMGVFVAIFLLLFAKHIILFLYGVEYLSAVLPLRIMVAGVFLRFIVAPLLQFFPSSGHPLYTSMVLAISLVFMAGTMPLLIPSYSVPGAAFSVFVGNLAGLITGYIIAVKKYGLQIKTCFGIRKTDISYVIRSIRSR